MTSDDQSGPPFSHQYSWDAEGRQTSVATVGGSTTNYTYDGDGYRVKKSGGSNTTLYWYAPWGDVLTETGADGSNPTEYIFFGGRRIARRDSSGNVSYYLSDILGSSRVIADSNGNLLDDCDFLPYGSEVCAASSSGNHYKFDGMERDSESGLDHTLNRQYASNYGRWLSPDMVGGRLDDPQTLNKYGYVRNSPTTLTDPAGLYICNGTKEQCKGFELARNNILNNRNATEAELRAANSYGDPGKDNGVHVSFADKLKGDRGGITKNRGTGVESDPNDPMKGIAAVDVKILSSEAGSEETVAHEGSHVADRQDVVSALNRGDMEAVRALNLTGRQSEVRAYQLSIRYAQRGNTTLNFGPCGLQGECKFPPGMLPALRDQRINDLLDTQYDPRDLNSLIIPGLP